jgi:hypothetical protein
VWAISLVYMGIVTVVTVGPFAAILAVVVF